MFSLSCATMINSTMLKSNHAKLCSLYSTNRVYEPLSTKLTKREINYIRHYNPLLRNNNELFKYSLKKLKSSEKDEVKSEEENNERKKENLIESMNDGVKNIKERKFKSESVENDKIMSMEVNDDMGDDYDDEIEPLREALEAAKIKATKSAFKRESLEAEAQDLAEVAIEAIKIYDRAKTKLYAWIQKKDSLNEQRSKLETELESLEIEWNAMKNKDTPKNDDALNKNDALYIEKLKTAYKAVEVQLDKIKSILRDIDIRISSQKERVIACKAVARDAEQRVQSVMDAAESAVTAELESQAVLKETQNAFKNAMLEINVITSQDVEFESDKLKRKMKQILKNNIMASKSTKEKEEVKTTEKETVEEKKKKKKVELITDVEEEEDEIAKFVKNNKALLIGIICAIGSAMLFFNTPLGETYMKKTIDFIQMIYKDPSIITSYMVPEGHGAEAGLYQSIWLLLMSVVMVPLVCKVLPGATPVLGFLAAGALVGPHALGIVKNINEVRHLAELGVVFLLFNIGLELSLERLRSMAKFVFGMGSTQVLISTVAIALVASLTTNISGAGTIVLGAALALSSTAVAMQVLQERGESGTRHGRATFSILLLQDLAVVVVLMLIPLLAQQTNSGSGGSGSGGLINIFKTLGIAGIKAIACIVGIMLGGRVLVRPIYKMVANFNNKEIFSALTLFVVLGASVLTQVFGLSLALGAFLAGLLLAETDYVIQVESDIEPYKGVLMGLFFMTVGMEISVQLFLNKWLSILTHLTILMTGKIALIFAIGKLYGLSNITSFRSGLLLGAGGEFAFVAFGEAVQQGLLPSVLVNQLYMTVSLSMALIPYMAILGAEFGKNFEKGDVKAMQPSEDETSHFNDHVIIAGFGRVGQLIADLLSERMIPFVAVDSYSERVQKGKSSNLPVYFGDAGSRAVLHSVGAERAACVVAALDSPGANYRCVWTMKRHFPEVKTYVRAFDMDHAQSLEKAGASVVIPEALEPSLQLAASVLLQTKTPADEVGIIIDEFRRDHLAELKSLTEENGSSLGYGFNSPLIIQKSEEEEQDSLESIDTTIATQPI